MKKKKAILLMLASALVVACNSSGKESKGKTDNINGESTDMMTSRNNTGIDLNDASTTFLIKAANAGMTEKVMTALAANKATITHVKDFATMLHSVHTDLTAAVRELARQKKVLLPAAVTPEKQEEIDELKLKSGKNFDILFMKKIIEGHEAAINFFSATIRDANDPDVRALAEKSLPALQTNLDSAKHIQRMYY